MKLMFQTLTVTLAACAIGSGQTTATNLDLEFEVAAIKAVEPHVGHFPSAGGTSKGGPGTADPTLFRCTGCSLSFLITKAFELERYQFPGRLALPEASFDVNATVPAGATTEQFSVMLQNLLKQRFNLKSHFDEKQMQGYELVIGKSGHKLKESKQSAKVHGGEAGGGSQEAGGGWHGSGGGGSHDLTRPGLFFFNGQGQYRGEQQSTRDLAKMIGNQLSKPVDDHTGLKGKYDISLKWTDDGSHAASHAPIAPGGGGNWGGHGEGGGSAGGVGLSEGGGSGVTLIGAVQSQLGLTLKKGQATAKIFTVDSVDKVPTAN